MGARLASTLHVVDQCGRDTESLDALNERSEHLEEAMQPLEPCKTAAFSQWPSHARPAPVIQATKTESGEV